MQAFQLRSLAKPVVSLSASNRLFRGERAWQGTFVMQSSCWKEAGMEDPPLPRLRNVFVYGTLLAPEVVSVLIDRVPRTSPACLSQYRRYALRGRNYPAAIPFPGSEIIGKVLFDLTDEELAVLDAFEDIEYTKELVEPIVVEPMLVEPMLKVDCMERGQSTKLQALIYLWGDVKDEKLEGEWDYEAFREKFLEDYVRLCEEFISEYYKSE